MGWIEWEDGLVGMRKNKEENVWQWVYIIPYFKEKDALLLEYFPCKTATLYVNNQPFTLKSMWKTKYILGII